MSSIAASSQPLNLQQAQNVAFASTQQHGQSIHTSQLGVAQIITTQGSNIPTSTVSITSQQLPLSQSQHVASGQSNSELKNEIPSPQLPNCQIQPNQLAKPGNGANNGQPLAVNHFTPSSLSQTSTHHSSSQPMEISPRCSQSASVSHMASQAPSSALPASIPSPAGAAGNPGIAVMQQVNSSVYLLILTDLVFQCQDKTDKKDRLYISCTLLYLFNI